MNRPHRPFKPKPQVIDAMRLLREMKDHARTDEEKDIVKSFTDDKIEELGFDLRDQEGIDFPTGLADLVSRGYVTQEEANGLYAGCARTLSGMHRFIDETLKKWENTPKKEK